MQKFVILLWCASDESVKSLFPLPWWEGIKGRGKIIAAKY
jgi:hypothetical protein